jgi:uncharacterized protein YgiM (DUF1202 family)
MKRFMIVILCSVLALMACNFSASRELSAPASPTITPTSAAWIITATPNTTTAPTLTPTSAPTATPLRTQGSSGSSSTSSSSSGSSSYVPIGYVVNVSAPRPSCSVAPNGAFNVNIRTTAALNGPVVGTLIAGSWVRVAQRFGDWYQVSYPGTPVQGAWISASVVELRAPCNCTPGCSEPAPQPQACQIQNHMAQGVVAGPGSSYGNIGQLGPETVSTVYARTSNATYYKIAYSAGVGWISGVANVTLIGNCTAIPFEDPPDLSLCRIQNHATKAVIAALLSDEAVIGQLPPQTVSTVQAKTGDNTYYKIAFGAQYGWIDATTDVTLIGNCASVPIEVPVGLTTCLIQNQMAQGVAAGPGANYPHLSELGPLETHTALARSSSGWYKLDLHYDGRSAWIDGTAGNTIATGRCSTLPVEDPPPPDAKETYTNSTYGYAFDFPSAWYLNENYPQGVRVTSFNPGEGEPPHAAYADPTLISIVFEVEVQTADDLESWVALYKQRASDTGLEIFAEQPLALPGGVPALRLDMVSGTGGFPVMLAVINGHEMLVEGLAADTNLFNSVVTTLRPAP